MQADGDSPWHFSVAFLFIFATILVTVLQASFGPLLTEIGLTGSALMTVSVAALIGLVDAVMLLLGVTFCLVGLGVLIRVDERRVAVLMSIAAMGLLGSALLEFGVVIVHIGLASPAPTTPSLSLGHWFSGGIWGAISLSNAVLVLGICIGLRRIGKWTTRQAAIAAVSVSLLMPVVASVI